MQLNGRHAIIAEPIQTAIVVRDQRTDLILQIIEMHWNTPR